MGMASSVCINHTDRIATARCHTCHKPLCADCVLKGEAGTFCSVNCQANYEKFMGQYEVRRRPGFFTKLKNLLVTLFALGLIAAVVLFVGGKIMHWGWCVDLLKRMGL